MNTLPVANTKKSKQSTKTSELEKFRLFFEYVDTVSPKKSGTYSVSHRLTQHQHGRQ